MCIVIHEEKVREQEQQKFGKIDKKALTVIIIQCQNYPLIFVDLFFQIWGQ